MNLHIVPDSKFSSTFYDNLLEGGLEQNNKVIVRTPYPKLTYIPQKIPFGKLYSNHFDALVGDTREYDKVFIHQLSPLMYRWIARHSFRELNWMTWGTDLYSLPFVRYNFYEPLTLVYKQKRKFQSGLLYLLKVYLTNMPFRTIAYSKIDHVLTWMESEFEFAKDHIPSLKATHQFFFYENQLPYQALDKIEEVNRSRDVLKIVVGNSGTPTNNHLDAIRTISDSGIRADLYIPVSYGEKDYVEYLKKNVSFYKGGTIEFVDRYMAFEEYIRFLASTDALVMNHIRPQGYGNIFMMMYLGKPVFLNDKNISLPDLRLAGMRWCSINEIYQLKTVQALPNKEKVNDLLSHEKLVSGYRKLFS